MVASSLGMLKGTRSANGQQEGQIPSLSPQEVAAGRRLPQVQLVNFSAHCSESRRCLWEGEPVGASGWRGQEQLTTAVPAR